MAVIQDGGSTSGIAAVDASFAMRTNTNQVNQRLGGETPNPNFVGAVRCFFENDSGSVTGSPELFSPEITDDKRMKVGQDTLIWHGMFPGAAQNTAVWKHLFTTMTATQAGDGFIVLNSNLTATTATGCSMNTNRFISFQDVSSYTVTHQLSMTNGQPVANQILEWGVFVPTATAAPADGIYWRYSTAGLYGYVKFGGNAEVPSGLLMAANSLTLNTTYDCRTVVDERTVGFWVNGIHVGEIPIPTGVSNVCQSLGLPLAFQQRNSGAVSGTQMQAKFSCTSLYQNDINLAKQWPHQMSGLGFAHQGLDGGTMGSLALIANNQNTGADALANATAAAAHIGLGGHFNVLPTLTVGTDGILCSYQNPAGSTTQPGRTLVITGVWMHAVVSTVFVGGPIAFMHTLCWGHTSVSLATTESASFANNTAKAPRRLALGVIGFPVTAAVGTVGAGGPIVRQFTTPIVVHPGEFVAIASKNMGVVTTSGVLSFIVGFDHYFE